MKTKIFKSPFGHVEYCLVCSKKKFNKLCKRKGLPKIEDHISDGANGTTHMLRVNGKMHVVVCVQKGFSDSDMMGLIVHEAVHVWQIIREEMGEESPSDEFEAYSLQWIAQNLFEEYQKEIDK